MKYMGLGHQYLSVAYARAIKTKIRSHVFLNSWKLRIWIQYRRISSVVMPPKCNYGRWERLPNPNWRGTSCPIPRVHPCLRHWHNWHIYHACYRPSALNFCPPIGTEKCTEHKFLATPLVFLLDMTLWSNGGNWRKFFSKLFYNFHI